MVKSFEFIVNTIVLEGFAGCVRERKKVSKNIKNVTHVKFQINTKSMWKRCSKKWCQNNGNMNEHESQKVTKVQNNMEC